MIQLMETGPFWIAPLNDPRKRTIELTHDLPDFPPAQAIINPPLSEIGHLACCHAWRN